MTSILYVDDIAILTQLFAKGLTEAGYETLTATSGSECLTILDNTTPDIIILDIMMEPMDGWNVLLQLRKRDPSHTILVVMLTAKALSPEDVREYGYLFDGYIMKPLTIEKLITYVKWYCEKLQEIDHAISLAVNANENVEAVRADHILRIRIQIWETLIQTYKKRLASSEASYISNDEFANEILELENRLSSQKESLSHGMSQIENKSV